MIEATKKRGLARTMYLHLGYPLTEISELLEVPYATVSSWKRRGNWDELPAYKRLEDAYDARLRVLIMKPDKTVEDLREIEILGREQRKNELHLKRLNNYQGGKKDKDYNPKLSNSGRKTNTQKNYLNPEQVEQLKAAFLERLYPHQQTWYDNIHHRIRNIMKSRQVGATDYFSHEAFIDGIFHGRNKNFLSASRAQALLFHSYIISFVYRVTGVELKGGTADKPMVIRTDEHPDTEFRFLSTNSNSAQGPHGDVIIDEYFWIQNFTKLRRVASAMATQKQYRLVYISTPSTVNHQAYPFWSGEAFNKGRKKADHITIDISHAALKHGRLCEDNQWRQVVTLSDACKQGFDLSDEAMLKAEYSGDEYRNLFECEFIDDSQAVFKFESLTKCMVDTLEVDGKTELRKRWTDWNPDQKDRPFGNMPVWVGYDPSRTTDAAAVVVLAPPLKPGGKFRVIERQRIYGASFRAQADILKNVCERYNVTEMGMDVTGMGLGVFELVTQGDEDNDPIFIRCKPIHYSAESKTELVTKGVDIVESKRIEFDASATDLVKSFLAIYRTSTDNGTVTYKANRSADVGHADEAFALLHALSFEPLNNMRRKMKVRVSNRNKRKRKPSKGDGYYGNNDNIVSFRPSPKPNVEKINDDSYRIAA